MFKVRRETGHAYFSAAIRRAAGLWMHDCPASKGSLAPSDGAEERGVDRVSKLGGNENAGNYFLLGYFPSCD